MFPFHVQCCAEARARGDIDVVVCDTAGRLHTAYALMEELEVGRLVGVVEVVEMVVWGGWLKVVGVGWLGRLEDRGWLGYLRNMPGLS